MQDDRLLHSFRSYGPTLPSIGIPTSLRAGFDYLDHHAPSDQVVQFCRSASSPPWLTRICQLATAPQQLSKTSSSPFGLRLPDYSFPLSASFRAVGPFINSLTFLYSLIPLEVHSVGRIPAWQPFIVRAWLTSSVAYIFCFGFTLSKRAVYARFISLKFS